jgi:geranylgeranyl transferase type-2 subunit alpha
VVRPGRRGYRLAITGRCGTPAAAEFDFTTEKVNTNFSNYSAWHYRARFFTLLYAGAGARHSAAGEEARAGGRDGATGAAGVGGPGGGGGGGFCLRDKLREESSMVHGAVYTDPADQSPWIYLRWIVSQFVPERQVPWPDPLLLDTCSCLILLQF